MCLEESSQTFEEERRTADKERRSQLSQQKQNNYEIQSVSSKETNFQEYENEYEINNIILYYMHRIRNGWI